MTNQQIQSRATGVFGLLAIWLLTHRYFGIQHDGLFYAVQALANLNQADYGQDLFFAFGSQDDYSAFGRFYATAVSAFGLDRAALVGLVCAHLCWIAAAFVLARQIAPGRCAWIATALLFSLPGHYGSQAEAAHDVLRYGESFLTARSWAEPLVLAGIAATLALRYRIAVVAMAFALLCHPIMGLPGAMFYFAFRIRPGIRILLALAAFATTAAALLPEMDPAWLAEVRRHARFVLLDTWSWGELLEPLAWIGILLAASALASDRLRVAFRSLALAGAAGYCLAVLATISHAALLIQAQPWRCLWLLKVAAILALATIFADRWRRSEADRWLVAGLSTAALTAQTLGGPVAVALAILAHRAWRDGTPPDLPKWLPAAGYAALGATLLESLAAILQQLGMLAQRASEIMAGGSHMPLGDLAAYFQGPLFILLPVGFALLFVLQLRRPYLALAMAVLAVGLAASGWNRSNDRFQQFVYASHQPRPFGNAVSPGETVLWHGNLLYTWFVLRQSHYVSSEQGASALFSRRAAMETARRQAHLSRFDEEYHVPGTRKKALQELCSDPALDVVILGDTIDGLPADSWLDPLRNAPWYMYRCAQLRT